MKRYHHRNVLAQMSFRGSSPSSRGPGDTTGVAPGPLEEA